MRRTYVERMFVSTEFVADPVAFGGMLERMDCVRLVISPEDQDPSWDGTVVRVFSKRECPDKGASGHA